VNDLILAAFESVAHDFLEHTVKGRISRFDTAEYSIFTNCLDSHLWFNDPVLTVGLRRGGGHSLPAWSEWACFWAKLLKWGGVYPQI
jgi:hypothetical protein